jgi:2-polyprenyl-3-methyl-5-hydroxy-6-metoxy-1,4-benzoquinol methylase
VFLDAGTDLYLGKPFLVDYYQCGRCGLVQQHPLPADVSNFYDAYPIHEAKAKAYSWFRRRLMSGVYLPPTQWPAGARLLDFGCGDGWYLEWCKEFGLDAMGFEYSADHARALNHRLGIEVLSDLVLLAERCAERFHVVTLHFVVEHLIEPIRTFELLRKLLHPISQVGSSSCSGGAGTTWMLRGISAS